MGLKWHHITALTCVSPVISDIEHGQKVSNRKDPSSGKLAQLLRTKDWTSLVAQSRRICLPE